MPKRFWTDKTKAIALMLKSQGWKRREIAEYFGCSANTLDTMFRRMGL